MEMEQAQGQKRRRMGLRARLVLLIVGLVCFVVVLIASYFIHRHQADMRAAMISKSHMMREDLRDKGMALARNVALASERAIAVMDFLFLTEVINTTVRGDHEIVYGIIMNKDRRALVDSDPSEAAKVLSDPAAMFAARQTKVTSQELTRGGHQILEVVSPIQVAGQRWGTIRFGMSLAKLNREIAQNEKRMRAQIRSSLLAALVAAVVLILVGSGIGSFAAGTIVGPLTTLMKGVQRIDAGDLEHTVEVKGSSEFVELSRAFNEMTRSVRERNEALRQNMAEIAQALEKAEEASRLKSEFLANISHELRTPLNTIVNVPAALLRHYDSIELWHCGRCGADFQSDGEPPADGSEVERCPDCDVPLERRTTLVYSGEVGEQQYFLERLEQSGKHLLSVVNDLLDFSKIEAGRMELHRTDVDLRDVLQQTLHTLEPLAQEKGITLTQVAGDEPLMVKVDEVKVAQIVINLVGNAIKFTDHGGVEVKARPFTDAEVAKVEITVRDTGMGIPDDQLQSIFESFRQVDGSHTRQHGGTGLGLAITKRLVEMHNGRIWADSRVGEGSCFHIIMPRDTRDTRATTQRAAEPARAPAAGESRQVLVIDDNHVQLELARMVLDREGFVTTLLDDATEAVQQVKQMHPSVVILDVMMPKVSGITVLERLKEDPATRDIPVVVASAYHSNRDVVERLGGIWLPKPWSAADLVDRLRKTT